MYTYKNSFFTVLLWGGWLIANIKLQKSLLVGHTVAHVVKKRETRYDKEKARLKVVLFFVGATAAALAATACLRSREKF